MVAEMTEVESGKLSDRPKLAEALKLCRLHGATLIIAKLDRLARNVAFISNLMESGVEFPPSMSRKPTASRFASGRLSPSMKRSRSARKLHWQPQTVVASSSAATPR